MSRRRAKPLTPEEIATRAAQRRADERASAHKPDTWGADTKALAAQPDVIAIIDLKGRVQTARRRSGIDWLAAKGRLEPHQLAAALKYGDLYRSATDIHLRSCINDGPRGGDAEPAQEVKRKAAKELSRLRAQGLSGHAQLIDLCNRVVGEGETIRSLAKSDADAQKFEERLRISLDLIAQHYGIIPSWPHRSSM